jgi:hypothetical protein
MPGDASARATRLNAPSPSAVAPAATVETTYESAQEPFVTKLFVPSSAEPAGSRFDGGLGDPELAACARFTQGERREMEPGSNRLQQLHALTARSPWRQ